MKLLLVFSLAFILNSCGIFLPNTFTFIIKNKYTLNGDEYHYKIEVNQKTDQRHLDYGKEETYTINFFGIDNYQLKFQTELYKIGETDQSTTTTDTHRVEDIANFQTVTVTLTSDNPQGFTVEKKP